jgi:hypothetical protein
VPKPVPCLATTLLSVKLHRQGRGLALPASLFCTSSRVTRPCQIAVKSGGLAEIESEPSPTLGRRKVGEDWLPSGLRLAARQGWGPARHTEREKEETLTRASACCWASAFVKPRWTTGEGVRASRAERRREGTGRQCKLGCDARC